MESIVHLLSDARGIYIPRDFAENFNFGEGGWTGVSQDSRDILADPHHEHYWEVWEDVLNNATYVDKESDKVYNLHQDGDLWAVCYDTMTDEEKISFGWEI